jgi:hypothetical protein
MDAVQHLKTRRNFNLEAESRAYRPQRKGAVAPRGGRKI